MFCVCLLLDCIWNSNADGRDEKKNDRKGSLLLGVLPYPILYRMAVAPVLVGKSYSHRQLIIPEIILSLSTVDTTI